MRRAVRFETLGERTPWIQRQEHDKTTIKVDQTAQALST
jgi:hypothetical protein